jgi:hypothetical protein
MYASACGITERIQRTFALEPKLLRTKFGWKMEDLINTIRDLVAGLTMKKLPKHGGTPDDDITYSNALSEAYAEFLRCRN